MTESTPVAQEAPQAALFAGADPIEDENLGNFGEYFDNPPPAPVAETAPVADTPPAEGGAPVPDTGSATPEATPAPENTAPVGEPVGDQAAPEPAAAGAADPEITPPPEQVEDQSSAEGADSLVPSYRLAQEAARRRQAEAYAQEMERRVQAAEATAAQQVQPQVPQVPVDPAPPVPAAPQPLDLGTDPKQMFDKVLDGDLDKATELFTDMMGKATAAQQQQAPAATGPTPDDVQSLVQQQMQAQRLRDAELSVVDALEAKYEVFNPTSNQFNKDLVDETLALKVTYEKMHYTPAEAMHRASAMVLNMNGIDTGQTAVPASPTAAPDPAAVKRNVEAQNATPPQMPAGAAQESAPEIDVTKLSQEDFEALPEATIARLRGDLL